jgi:hypothetical protein
MKLSNKILLGFFGIIFLYLTAAFTEVRLTGIPNIISNKNSIAETVDISGVKYLILNNVRNQIHVIGSDRAQLEVRSFAGNLLKELNYKVSGDTLTLWSNESEEKIGSVKISVSFPEQSLKGITVNNTGVFVRNLHQEHLYISQNAGRIWMDDGEIAKIEMDLSNHSSLDISGTLMDTVSANWIR